MDPSILPSSSSPVTPISPSLDPGTSTPIPPDAAPVPLAFTLAVPLVDASQPNIPLAQFFGAVASANRELQLQDFINRIKDPTLRNLLMQAAQDTAAADAGVIALIVSFQTLQGELNNIKLQDKINQVNKDIDKFDAGGSQDQTQVHDMNLAILNYNTAQTDYQDALNTYNGDLSTFATAQTTYNAALQAWNAALDAFNAGTINQTQLQNAQATFQVAQTAFNKAQATFSGPNGQQTIFNTAKTNWINAQTALTSEETTYNNYAEGRNATLPQNDIKNFNSAAAQAKAIIGQMNQILSILGLPLIASPSALSVIGLPIFDQGTPGPDTLRNSVEATLDGVNNDVTSNNGVISQIKTIIGTINAGGQTPPLVPPDAEDPVPTLPTEQSNFNIQFLSFTPPTDITFTLPPPNNLLSFLAPLIATMNHYTTLTEQEQRFTAAITDPKTPVHLSSGSNLVGGLGTNPAVTSISSQVGPQSPHLQGVLSRQVFDAFFNFYGVPSGSPLVDQTGSLVDRLQSVLGLLSIAPAQDIIAGHPIAVATGQSVAFAALSLGNIQEIQNQATNGGLTQAITAIVENDQSLANLSPEAKSAFIQNLTQEVLATLFKSALSLVGISIGIPGLLPQILAQLPSTPMTQAPPTAPPPPVTSQTAQNAQATASSQAANQINAIKVFLEAVLSKELVSALNVSTSVAQSLAHTALEQENNIISTITDNIAKAAAVSNTEIAEENAATERRVNTINSESIASSIMNQVQQQGAVSADVQHGVVNAVANTQAQLHREIIQAAEAKRDVFLNALASSIEAENIDSLQIHKALDQYRPTLLNAFVSGLITPSLFNAIAAHIVSTFNLTQAQADKLIAEAQGKAQVQPNGAVNPLSSFLGEGAASMSALAGLFKAQTTNFLTPIVGTKDATTVAENYGRLIFEDSNSVTKVLQNHESNLKKLENYNSAQRAYEDYWNATVAYLNPQTADSSPLNLGKTLLMSGQGGGVAYQGTTNVDNTLGPSGYRYKHATDYPGILG